MRWRPPRLRDVDARDRNDWLRIGLPVFLMLFIAEMMLERTGRISRGQYLLLFWIANPILVIALTWILHHLLHRASELMVGAVNATESTEPMRQYSEQDALLMQGRHAEAADMFRAIIVEEPDNLDVRLRLASLLELHLRQDDAAEALFLEVRALGPSRQQEQWVGNGLIDLYRRAGRMEDLKRELARMARLREGTPEGHGARRYLRELLEGGDQAPGGRQGTDPA